MKNLIKYFLTAWILLSVSLPAGSYFSAKAKGLGLRSYTTGVRGFGMGNTGLAATDSIMLNSYVTSQWRRIDFTRATFGMYYQRFNTDLENSSFSTSSADLAGMNIAVPLKHGKWVLGLSLQPYTGVDFKTSQTVERDSIAFTQYTLSTGSISKAQFSLIWSPFPALGLALNGNYYFGALRDNYEFRFEESSFLSTSHTIKYSISGPGVGVSMDFQPVRAVSVGGFVDFQSSTDLKTTYLSQTTTFGDKPRNFDRFPLHYGIGASFMVDQRWSLAVDYTAQNWAKTLRDENSEFDTWSHTGVGIERKQSPKRRNVGFFDRMDLRAGYSNARLGYKFNGETVTQNALHLGLGIPFSSSLNRIDIGVETGVRGDLQKHLAKEQYTNFQVSISIGELWFQKIR